jgi:dTDP-glucose pyrophosphorylase
MAIGRPGVVALVPAAGSAKRIAPLPCSKELFPIGFQRDGAAAEPRAKVVSHYLIDKFRIAGITSAFFVLRNGKWDIPTYYGDGEMVGIDLAYVVVGETRGPPDTLDRAYSFVRNRTVAFGFPDMLFGPDDVFDRLLRQLEERNADVILGLYPAHDPRLMDMVDISDEGVVRSIVLKPQQTDLRYAWICAVWASTFTEHMHVFVANERKTADGGRMAYEGVDPQGDLPFGMVIKAALHSGLRVSGVTFPEENYIDIGTPADLVRATTSFCAG